MERRAYRWTTLGLLAIAHGCSGEPTTVSSNSDLAAPNHCSASAFQSTINSFCQKEFPPPPAAGQTGADCTNNTQCNSGFCLMPFGSASYCSLMCPQGNECPAGYTCQSLGTVGSGCYRSVCAYAGSDLASCVTNLNTEAGSACQEGCASQLSAWLTCLDRVGFVCGNTEARMKCGIERGTLESCCVGCDRSSF